MKKFLSKILLFFALTPFAVHAILPLIAGGLVMATNSTTLTTALFGSALVVGAAVGFIGMAGDPATTPPANSPLLVKVNPAEKMPTPAGWTAPVTPSVQPTPPASLNAASAQAAFPNWPSVTKANTFCASFTVGEFVLSGTRYMARGNGTQFNPVLGAGDTVSSCGPGDTVMVKSACPLGTFDPAGGTGSTCTVSNPGVVTKPGDGKCTVMRTGNSFAGDPLDPDCSVGNIPTTVTITGNEVIVKPTTTETQTVTTNADGTTTAKTTTINTTNNTTTTTTYNISNGGGVGNSKITGIGTTTSNGTGDLAGAGELKIPTDYNREVTQTAIKGVLDNIKAGQCGGTGQPKCENKIDETGTPTDGSLTTAKDAMNAAFADVITGVNNINGSGKITSLGADLPLTLPTSACENHTFAMPKGHGHRVEPLCSVSTVVPASMASIMAAMTVVSLWRCAVEATKD